MSAPSAPPLTPPAINALDEEAFVAAFGAVFEHSPWVARGAWRRRPFGDAADLAAAFEAAVREAESERRLGLGLRLRDLVAEDAR